MQMSTFLLYIKSGTQRKQISITQGESFLSALRMHKEHKLQAPCGGRGTCRQCKIVVTGHVASIHDLDAVQNVSEETILACQYTAVSDCEITLPTETSMQIATSGAGTISPDGCGLGLAIDIGTTTVAAFLYDLSSGQCLSVASDRNAQRAFGADVIARIEACKEAHGLQKLQAAILSQIQTLITQLCNTAACEQTEITVVSIAANTVMSHIFMQLSPTSLGVAPFTPVSLFGDLYPADLFLPELSKEAMIYIAPALSAYVGGDVVAGLYHSGAFTSPERCLYIDIGTNGEMGLGNADGYLLCATAAGPAFEGAQIECGMHGAQGAIARVYYIDAEIKYEVIGDIEPKGICGSGLIDALSIFLEAGIIDATGRMCNATEVPVQFSTRMKQTVTGQMQFHFTDDVYITAEDVRALQLAKAAIRGGIETLMEKQNCSYEDISKVLLAGGFGAFMRIESACAIGLLPPQLLHKTQHIGNAAGAGAALCLSKTHREELTQFVDQCKYYELSSSPLFTNHYMTAMFFEELSDEERSL